MNELALRALLQEVVEHLHCLEAHHGWAAREQFDAESPCFTDFQPRLIDFTDCQEGACAQLRKLELGEL